MTEPRPSAVETTLTIPCPCPGTPHPDGDTVTFHPHLTFDGGVAAMTSASRARLDGLDEFSSAYERDLGLTFIVHGVESWTFVRLDEKGKEEPLPVTADVVRGSVIPWSAMYPIWDRATDLYAVEAFTPLAPRLLKSSRNGQTGPSTSARKPGKRTRPKLLTPSSPAASAGTEK